MAQCVCEREAAQREKAHWSLRRHRSPAIHPNQPHFRAHRTAVMQQGAGICGHCPPHHPAARQSSRIGVGWPMQRGLSARDLSVRTISGGPRASQPLHPTEHTRPTPRAHTQPAAAAPFKSGCGAVGTHRLRMLCAPQHCAVHGRITWPGCDRPSREKHFGFRGGGETTRERRPMLNASMHPLTVGSTAPVTAYE